MNRKNPEIGAFLNKAKKWQEEMEKLRMLLLDCGLKEELKWGKPCYTFEKSNIVIIQGFKEFCALMFFKGALLKDPEAILKKPGENSQAARRIPFTGVQEITELEPVLRAYIFEAVELEKAGLKVNFEKNRALIFPEEFQNKLEGSSDLKAAFNRLTPGRQRAYNLYFSAPKRSETRTSRIEKCIPQILKGKGLNDR